MQLLTKPVIFISSFFILMIAAACKKDGNKAVIYISGFAMKDAAGNDLGHYGPADNDWTFKNTLSDRELALFDFLPDNVTLNNTVEASIKDDAFMAFPNPCTYNQRYYFTTSGKSVLKVVVVNDKLDVLKKTAINVNAGTTNLNMDYSDSLLFPNRSAVRVYYSFSAQNKPNYKAGYGDIKICRGDFNSCFP